MIDDITIYIYLAVGAFSLMIGSSLAGNIFLHGGFRVGEDLYGRVSVYIKIWFFILFLVLGFSLVPILAMVLVETLADMAGRTGFTMLLLENGMLIVYGFWIVFLAGFSIALPAIVKSGFFKPEKPRE